MKVFSSQNIDRLKENAVDNFICPVIIKLGVKAIPAVSLLVGEIALSLILKYGVILPSPIGIELMEFPVRMAYILRGSRKRAG